jgi:fermentation-respiration switch protein FrsA (DUF1100 family)
MQFALQLICWAIGVPLSLLVIAALLRGGYRLFPVLFVYQIVDFLMTIAGMAPYIAFYSHHAADARTRMAQWFWWDELLLQPLVYAVVISLIYRATEKAPARRLVRGVLIGGAALIAGASFLFHYHPELPNGDWMAFWTRDLTFSSAILDLALWALLLASRIKDTRLLLVSGGLGIQFTGEAIGESLRSMAVQHRSRPLSFTGSLITTLVDLLSVYIIWQAFRNYKGEDAKKRAAL